MLKTFVGRVDVKPKEGLVPQPPATQMFTVPADCVYVTAFVVARRPATFVVPPSIVNEAPSPAPITFVPTVPMFIVPSLTRSEPLLIGEPFWPAIVAFASLSQSPPVAGMVYAGAASTGFVSAPEPEILNVPLEIVRNPAVFAPCTVTVPPGTKSRIDELLVPLFRTIPRRSRVPLLFS